MADDIPKTGLGLDLQRLFLPGIVLLQPVSLEADDTRQGDAHEGQEPVTFFHLQNKSKPITESFSTALTFINLNERWFNLLSRNQTIALAQNQKNMKQIWITGLAILVTGIAQGQIREGKITYERTNQMVMRMNINGQESEMPRTRKDNFELTFTPAQTLWKAIENPDDDIQNNAGDGGGMQMHMIVIGNNDVLFTNLEKGTRTEKREMMDKSFIVDDSIKVQKWKMTGDTKSILGHSCMKATSTRISQRTTMTMDNGKMERKEVSDTSNMIAWFANDIPVSTGPAEFQGQLPGAILEMDISNGKQTFTATNISDKADLALIKEPTGKKHYTPAEYKKEVNKMMDEMQQNMGGGNRQIRIN